MLLRDDLIKLCQSDDASLDHSSWRGIGRRRGASEEGGESGEEEPDESLDWTGKCMNEHGLQTL